MSEFVLKSNSGNGYVADPKKTKSKAAYTASLSKARRYASKKLAQADAACDELAVDFASAKVVKV